MATHFKKRNGIVPDIMSVRILNRQEDMEHGQANCSLNVNTPDNINVHEKKFHQVKSINATTEDNKNYVQIAKGVDKVFVCQYCDRIFKSEGAIGKHIRNIHPGTIVSQDVGQNDCDICGQPFSNLKRLRNHKNKVHNTRRYKCNICDKLFTLKPNLNKHLKVFHPGFESKDHVWSVKNVHSDTNNKKNYLKCQICNRLLSEKSILKRHMEKVHSVAVTKRSVRTGALMRCWIKDCSAKFHTLHRLRLHLMKAKDAGGHNWIVEEEKKVFDNFEEFNQWKEDVEENENLRYVLLSQSFQKKMDGSIKRTYHCSRSGKYKEGKGGIQENELQTQASSPGLSHQQGQRRLFKKGTSKIGYYCPSSMDVHCYSLGTVKCTFFKTHGHDTANNVMHIPIHKRDKQFIIEKIGQGVEPKKILNDLHKKGGRSALIVLQDIKNCIRLQGKNEAHILGQENDEIYVSNIETVETDVVEHESISLYNYELGEPDYLIPQKDDRDKVLSEAQTILSGLSRTLTIQSGNSIDCIKAITKQLKTIDNAVQCYQVNNAAKQSSMPIIPN